MQGYGNHRNCPHRHCLFEIGHCLRHHAPQNSGRGTNLLELEHMDQVAQFTLIAAIGDCALKRRIGALTKQASRFPGSGAAWDV